MKFQSEIDLVETLKLSIKDFYNREYLRIFQEVSLGYGIADIVVSDVKHYQDRSSSIGETLNGNDVNVLDLIQNSGGAATEEIISATGCSKKSIQTSLKRLIERGYLQESGGAYQLNKHYTMVFRNNYAIEAKLKDWKRALKQAYRYRWFAEYAFVVLDTYYSSIAIKNISLFKKYNVGLASISVDGVLQRHFNPKRNQPFDRKMQMLFSEKVMQSCI